MAKDKKDKLDIGPFRDMEATCHYPSENKEVVIADIASGLQYLGFFDSL